MQVFDSFETKTKSWIFVDTSVLLEMFKDFHLDSYLKERFFKLAGFFMVERFVRFEFLRGVFLDKELEKRRQFLEDSGMFVSMENFFEVDTQVLDGLEIAKVFKHNNCAAGSSMVDLLLAASVKYFLENGENACILTSNLRDFPECIFDITGMSVFYLGDVNNQIRELRIYQLKFSLEKWKKRLFVLDKSKQNEKSN